MKYEGGATKNGAINNNLCGNGKGAFRAKESECCERLHRKHNNNKISCIKQLKKQNFPSPL